MKLKTSLWKKLLADLQVFEEEIEEQTQDSEMMRLVMALEHLDLDEEEAAKIAMAMERGRRGAVLLDWGDHKSDAEQAVRTTPTKAEDRSRSPARSRHGFEEEPPIASGVSGCRSSTEIAGTEDEDRQHAPPGVTGMSTPQPDQSESASSSSKFSVSSTFKKLSKRGSGSSTIPEAVPPSSRAEGVMRELTDDVRTALERCCANTVDKPPEEDVQALQALAHKASGGVMVPWLNESLDNALDACTTPVSERSPENRRPLKRLNVLSVS